MSFIHDINDPALIETSEKLSGCDGRNVILHKLYLNPLNFLSERIASIFFSPSNTTRDVGMLSLSCMVV